MFSIYLAGPISGLTPEESSGWRRRVTEDLRGRFYVFDPTDSHPERFVEGKPIPVTWDLNDFERDTWCLRLSDFVLVNLTGARSVSIGTVWEIGFSYALGKRVFLIPGSLHDHLFLQESAERIFRDLDECVTYLKSLQQESNA